MHRRASSRVFSFSTTSQPSRSQFHSVLCLNILQQQVVLRHYASSSTTTKPPKAAAAEEKKPILPLNPTNMTAPIAPVPKSLLGRHRLLSPTAAVRVSPLCLGAMNFGTAWNAILGECSKETAFEMLDYFYEMGGNFIDTANSYQAEQSEQWLGEWMKERGRRDEMIIATKYTTGFKTSRGAELQQSNYGGNGTKSLHVSVAASLKKLQTSYIDLVCIDL